MLDALVAGSICALGLMLVFNHMSARQDQFEANQKLLIERQQHFNDRDSLQRVLDQKDREIQQAKSRR